MAVRLGAEVDARVQDRMSEAFCGNFELMNEKRL